MPAISWRHVNGVVLALLISSLLPGPKYFLLAGLPLINIADNVLLALLLILVAARPLLHTLPPLSVRCASVMRVGLLSITLLKVTAFVSFNSFYEGSYNYWPIMPSEAVGNVCEEGTSGCFLINPGNKEYYKTVLGLNDLVVRVQDRLTPNDRPMAAFSPDNIWAFPHYSRRDAAIHFSANPKYNFFRWGYGSWRLGFFNNCYFASIHPPARGTRSRTTLPFLAHWQVHSRPGIPLEIQLRGELILKQKNKAIFDERSNEAHTAYTLPSENFSPDIPIDVLYGYQRPIFTGISENMDYAPLLKVTGIQPTPRSLPRIRSCLNILHTLVLMVTLWALLQHLYRSRASLMYHGPLPDRLVLCFFAATLLIGLLFVRGNQVLAWNAGGDIMSYEQQAADILSRKSLQGFENVFWYTPGQRYVVALGHLLFGEGHNFLAFLYAGFTYLFFLLIRRLTQHGNTRQFLGTAGIAVLFFAYPTIFLCFDGRNEVAAATCVLTSILLLRDKRHRAFLAGFMGGFSVFIRPDLLPLLAALLVFLIANKHLSPRVALYYLLGAAPPLCFSVLHNYYYGGKFVFFKEGVLHDSAWFIPPSMYFQALFEHDWMAFKTIAWHLIKTVTWGSYFHLDRLPSLFPAYSLQAVVAIFNLWTVYLTFAHTRKQAWINLLCLALMFSPYVFWATGGRRLYCAYLCVFLYNVYLRSRSIKGRFP